MHWRARIHSARSLQAADDRSPLGICISMHFVFNYIWAKRPKAWLCRSHTVTSEERTPAKTLEEEREFEAFQRGRRKYVVPFMKLLPLVFSDQPYLSVQTKKRTKLTEHPLYKKAKKEAKQKQLPLQPASILVPAAGDDGVSLLTWESSIKGST